MSEEIKMIYLTYLIKEKSVELQERHFVKKSV